MKTDKARPLQSSTADAWLMLWVGCGLYAIGTLFLAKVSVLGGTAAGQILFLFVPALLYAKWKTGGVRDALRLRPVARGIIWRVMLLAIFFVGLGSLLQQVTQPIMERYFSEYIPGLKRLTELLTPKSGTGFVGNLVVVGLLAPICEEVFFRGAFQGTIERRGPMRAILTSALVFALVHLNPFNFFGIILIGMALGFVTWRTQSLWPAILWHVVTNSAATVILYFGGESFSIPIWLNMILAAVFMALAWEFVRYTKREATVAPGPLATAAPLWPRILGRPVKVGGLAAAVLVLVLAVCVGRTRLASDRLAPQYSSGDIAIYIRGPAFQPQKVKVGDAVIYHQKDVGLKFSRILAIDADQITVIGQADGDGDYADQVIERKDLIGKIFWKFDPGEAFKKLTGH